MNFNFDDAVPNLEDLLLTNGDLLYSHEYETAKIYDFTSTDNVLNRDEKELTSDWDTGSSQDYHNNKIVYESISSIEICNHSLECNDAQQALIKEELIIDSMESTEEVAEITQTFDSNEIMKNILDNGSIENHENLDENTSEPILIQVINDKIPVTEHDKQKVHPDATKIFKRESKRNDILKYLRMYCHTCSKDLKCDGKNWEHKCFRCKRFMNFECMKCDQIFKNYHTAYSHIKYKCINESFFKCSKCNYKTWDKRGLHNHNKWRHGTNQCSNCGKKFKNHSRLQKHKKYECKVKAPVKKTAVYSFMEHCCQTCDQVVSGGRSSYKQQCIKCKQDLLMRCVKCKQPCDSYISAYTHLRYKCIRCIDLHCNDCTYKSPWKQNLATHIQNKHMPRKCDECDKECTDRTSLMLHKRSYHKHMSRKGKTKVYEMYCSNCDRSFNKECGLQFKNCLDCSTLLLYKCKVCAKTFKTCISIYAHRNRSCGKGSGLIKCSMCEFMSPLRYLRKHIRATHTALFCKKCGIKCENYSCLKTHMADECSFRANATAKCSLCDFSTTNKDLEKHIKFQHTACHCPKCKIEFVNGSALQQHLSKECIYRRDALISCPTCAVLVKRKRLDEHIEKNHTLIEQKCSLCDFSTMNKDLNKHIKFEHTACTCPKCEIELVNGSALQQHLLRECIYRSNALVNCPTCQKLLKRSNLDKHIKNQHTLVEQKCCLCDFSTMNNDLEKHIKFQHTICNCPKCKIELVNGSALQQHLSKECIYRRNALVNCPTCNKSLRRRNLDKHIKNKHTLIEQKCSLCDFSTMNNDLDKHIKLEHTACECTRCGMKFANHSALKPHNLRECTFKNPVVNCPVCNLSIKRYSLNAHINAKHSLVDQNCDTQSEKNGGLNIKCPLCGYLFSKFQYLQTHMKRCHTPHICPQCSMKCDNYHYMVKHQLHECSYRDQQEGSTNDIVYDINVFCSKCDLAAKLIYGLQVSTCSMCQNALKIQCGKCKNIFKSVKYTRAHIRTRCQNENTFPCQHCNKSWKVKYNLLRHMKTCHGDTNGKDSID